MVTFQYDTNTSSAGVDGDIETNPNEVYGLPDREFMNNMQSVYFILQLDQTYYISYTNYKLYQLYQLQIGQ